MSKEAIRDRFVERPHLFLMTRKPGRFSPKSKMLFIKSGPKYTELTPQQKKIAEAGRVCGAEIRGKFKGKENVEARRKAMAECIRRQFGKK